MAPTLQRFPAPPGEVLLFSTVQGLVSEVARVQEAFRDARPQALALGLSPESVAALLRYAPGMEGASEADLFEDLSDHEYVFAVKLKEYGEVALPPPDVLEAARLAQEAGAGVFGVDLTEEQYEDAFTDEIGALGLLRYGRVQRRLARRPPRAPDARSFSLAWDAAVRRVKGIARVEARREAAIAARARALAAEVGGTVLLLVDAPREEGVARALRA